MKPPTHSCGHVSQRRAGTRGWRPPVPPWLWGASTLRAHHSVGTPPCCHTPPILAPLPPPPSKSHPKIPPGHPSATKPRVAPRCCQRDPRAHPGLGVALSLLSPNHNPRARAELGRQRGGSSVSGTNLGPPQLGQDPPPQCQAGCQGCSWGPLGPPMPPACPASPSRARCHFTTVLGRYF